MSSAEWRPEQGNVIAFNGFDGISLNSTRITIRGNSIHSNGGLGIDLGDDGVTPNDVCDADTGPNELQNFPVLTDAPSGTVFVTATATNSNGNTSEFSRCVRAQVSGGSVVLQGTMEGRASATFTLDFYSNTTCDASGNGEGQTYLGSTTVTTNASCNAPINVTPTPIPTPTPTPAPLIGEKIAFTSNRDGNNKIYVMGRPAQTKPVSPIIRKVTLSRVFRATAL